VGDYYLVRTVKGPSWDHARGRREQDGWDEHAAFMDGLVEEGLIVLGGGPAEHRISRAVDRVDAGGIPALSKPRGGLDPPSPSLPLS
jgi:hypothetical protein